MDFDMEQACAWIGTQVRCRDEQTLQRCRAAALLTIAERTHEQGAILSTLGVHVHGVEHPSIPRSRFDVRSVKWTPDCLPDM